jgi:hypothetical protein
MFWRNAPLADDEFARVEDDFFAPQNVGETFGALRRDGF